MEYFDAFIISFSVHRIGVTVFAAMSEAVTGGVSQADRHVIDKL
jgi:hypothetical protein